MIISRHSGNVIGYLEYYAAGSKSVSSVARVSRAQRVRRDDFLSAASESSCLRFCRKRVEVQIKEAGQLIRIWQRFYRPTGVYNSKGKYSPVDEIGNFINITI
ncbi:MAG: hypothetical protein PHQ46_08965 [Negativicutes bacterium]|nr:hypothetical protein [Negativicutes bacterium]